jgi:addiction module HigA family antidote
MAKVVSQSPGSVLGSLLEEFQLNPTRLAKDIKLSQSAVRQITIGKTKISVSVALRLAKYFGKTPDYWLGIQNDYDLAEAARDSELQSVLKAIVPAKKPAPGAKDKAPKAEKAPKKGSAKAKEPAKTPKAPKKPKAK